jgi:hypothetical protein
MDDKFRDKQSVIGCRYMLLGFGAFACYSHTS